MNPEPKEEFLPRDVCPALRTKTMTLNTHYRPTPFEERHRSDVAIFHCLKTMMSWGPDEDDVTPEGCRPGRSCWCGDDPA